MTKISTKLVGNKLVDRIAYQIVRFIVTTFCRVWCRMTVEGSENVPAEGIFILAPTHRSILDTPIASGVTRRRMRFMGADKYWKNKAFGRLLTALGGFPVSRGTADREALKRSIAVLQGGRAAWCCSPRASASSGRSCSRCSTARPTSPSRPVCRSFPSGSVAPSEPCPRVPSSSGPASCTSWSASRFRPSTNATSPKDQRDAARQLTVDLHAELQRLFDIAQARVL